MSPSAQPVLTIGHSTHSFETFLAILRRHEVTALADVRSTPYSRFAPQFNREALENGLPAHHVKYVFLGRELGARSEDRSCYLNGRVQYSRLAATQVFRSGLERVIRGARDHCIALMCTEKDPLDCHRTLLVARALDIAGVEVKHILADGHLESHESAMLRLLRLMGLPNEDLFRSRPELISLALAKQEERIAYQDKELVAEAIGAA